jgi:hypothetical protein
MKNSSAALRTRAGGYAYVWLLIMIAVLAGAAARIVEVNSVARQREKEQQLIVVGQEFREAIRRYHAATLADGEHQYPQHLDELLEDRRFLPSPRYLRKLYHDPVTGTRDWGLVTEGGRIVGVHSLSTAAPIKRSSFGASEARFGAARTYAEWQFVYPYDR